MAATEHQKKKSIEMIHQNPHTMITMKFNLNMLIYISIVLIGSILAAPSPHPDVPAAVSYAHVFPSWNRNLELKEIRGRYYIDENFLYQCQDEIIEKIWNHVQRQKPNSKQSNIIFAEQHLPKSKDICTESKRDSLSGVEIQEGPSFHGFVNRHDWQHTKSHVWGKINWGPHLHYIIHNKGVFHNRQWLESTRCTDQMLELLFLLYYKRLRGDHLELKYRVMMII